MRPGTPAGHGSTARSTRASRLSRPEELQVRLGTAEARVDPPTHACWAPALRCSGLMMHREYFLWHGSLAEMDQRWPEKPQRQARYLRDPLRGQEASRRVTVPAPDSRSTSIVVMLQPSKLMSGVRFPGGAPSVASINGDVPGSYPGEQSSILWRRTRVWSNWQRPRAQTSRVAGPNPATRTQ